MKIEGTIMCNLLKRLTLTAASFYDTAGYPAFSTIPINSLKYNFNENTHDYGEA